MEETKTTEVGTNQNTQIEEQKTFTQEEVNRIVQERVFKERSKFEGFEDLKAKAAKYDEMEEASKTELQKATERAEKLEAELKGIKAEQEIRAIKDRVSAETGVPVNLLTGNTEEDCKSQAEAILGFANVNGYPQLKDGGEVTKVSKPTTRQQFAEWAEKNL
jgi:hypothetical protein